MVEVKRTAIQCWNRVLITAGLRVLAWRSQFLLNTDIGSGDIVRIGLFGVSRYMYQNCDKRIQYTYSSSGRDNQIIISRHSSALVLSF